MNLLEHYIEEVISVTEYKEAWTKEYEQDFVEVHLTANCYGNIQKYRRVFSKGEWEKIQQQGYFLA